MKEYELTVEFHPDLEMNLAPAVQKVDDLIKEYGGEIIRSTNEGKKHLAYPIEGQDYAVFYFYEVKLPPTAPAKLSNAFNISDEVIRYLLVTRDARRRKALESAAEAAAHRTAAAETEADEDQSTNPQEEK